MENIVCISVTPIVSPTYLRSRPQDLGKYSLYKCNSNWVSHCCKSVPKEKLSDCHGWNVVTPGLYRWTAHYFSLIRTSRSSISFVYCRKYNKKILISFLNNINDDSNNAITVTIAIIRTIIKGAKDDWDFQIYDLLKNPDGTDI